MRVHDLVKELGIPSKDIIAALNHLGVEAKNNMTALEDADVLRLRTALAKGLKTGDLKKEKPPAAKKEPAKPAPAIFPILSPIL